MPSNSAAAIVIGIDFGTSYCGVSWAVNGGEHKVHTIADWPLPQHEQGSGRLKVPTTISYSSGKPKDWGYRVSAKDTHFKHLIALLEQGPADGLMCPRAQPYRELLATLGKSAQSVVSDYLRFLLQYTRKDIQRKHPTFPHREVVTGISLAVSDTGLGRPLAPLLYAAVHDSGVCSSVDITVVAGHEVIGHAVIPDTPSLIDANPDDVLIICDAGATNVGTASYERLDEEPSRYEKPGTYVRKPCHWSILLDEAFRCILSTRISEEQWDRIPQEYKDALAYQWGVKSKPAFRPGEGPRLMTELRCIIADMTNIILAPWGPGDRSMFLQAFENAVAQIDDALSSHVADIQRRGRKVKAIVPVGGFSANYELLSRLEDRWSAKGIPFVLVNDSWSAVSRGATRWALRQLRAANPPDPRLRRRRPFIGSPEDESTSTSGIHLATSADTHLRIQEPEGRTAASGLRLLPVLDYLREKPCRLYMALHGVAVCASFIIGLSYAVAKDDVSGGFTIGGFLLTAAALVITQMQGRHRPRCRCND